MLLTFFIAILLGLAAPSNTNNQTPNTTISNNNHNDFENPEDINPGYDTGGGTGNNPPR